MANREYYQPVGFMPVRAQTTLVYGSDGVTPECLFQDPEIPDFAVAASIYAEFPDERPRIALKRITSLHGRAFELTIDGMEGVGAWGDEYGILYSSFDIKGIDLNSPKVRQSPTSYSGFDVHGLQDRQYIPRTVDASRRLRELGIETENTVRVIVPEELPMGSLMLEMSDFKRELKGKPKSMIYKILSRIPVDPEFRRVVREDREMTEYLDGTSFVFTLRSMQVPERLQDLLVDDPEVAQGMLERAFDFVNFSERVKGKGDPDHKPEFFDINNHDDVVRYFSKYLPRKLGKYFGIMHTNGIAHIFPHLGNISTVGSIYDLDSVIGNGILGGDPSPAEADYGRDFRVPEDLGKLISDPTFQKNFLNPEDDPSAIVTKMNIEFMDSYLSHINPDSAPASLATALSECLERNFRDRESALLIMGVLERSSKIDVFMGVVPLVEFDSVFKQFEAYWLAKARNISKEDFTDKMGTVKEVPGITGFEKLNAEIIEAKLNELGIPKDFARILFESYIGELVSLRIGAQISLGKFWNQINQLMRVWDNARANFRHPVKS